MFELWACLLDPSNTCSTMATNNSMQVVMVDSMYHHNDADWSFAEVKVEVEQQHLFLEQLLLWIKWLFN